MSTFLSQLARTRIPRVPASSALNQCELYLLPLPVAGVYNRLYMHSMPTSLSQQGRACLHRVPASLALNQCVL